jgi:DNA-directed RNA polymerase subunit N (RpoN/RPB10)
MTCFQCGKPLSGDEIAIFKKLVNRGAEKFLCIDCLAEHFKCPREAIEARIRYYRETGTCALFN